MVYATNSILNQAPKTFDGVGVNIAFDVHAAGMLDSPMPILQWDSLIVSQELN
jgi:hypothetical protein